VTSELPDLLSIQAQAVVDRAKSLGLTWTLRPATVNSEIGPTVIFDGDTEGLGVQSLIGAVSSSQRVMMLQVPPGGNYIIGALTGGEEAAAPAMVGTMGTMATATTALEVAISSANWVTEPTFTFPPGRIFKCHMTGGIYNTAGGPRVILLRVRLGQSNITGTQLLFRPWLCDLIGGVGGSYDWTGYFKNSGTDTVTSKLSLTIINFSTAGTVAIYGDTQQVNQLVVTDFCSINDSPGLAAVCISV
jgi:hypothetical protein